MKSVDQSTLAREIELLAENYVDLHDVKLEQNFLSLISIVWVYFYYRQSRPTQVDQITLPTHAEILGAPLKDAFTISIFPACDYVCIDEPSRFGSRFFKKCLVNLPSFSVRQLHQIVRDYNGRTKHLKKEQRGFTIIGKSYVSVLRFLQVLPKSVWIFSRNIRFLLFISKRARLKFFKSTISAIINYHSNLLHFSVLLNANSNIKKIFLSNFYSPENLGVICAANKIGVRTFDLQHGVQKNVFAYEKMEQLSPELRPTKLVFWENKATATRNAMQIKNGMKYSEKKICLVSLQPSNDQYFLSDIRKLVDKGYSVILRPHPRRNGPIYLAQLEEYFSDQVVISRNDFIDDDFAICDLHVSEYSSSLIESAELGIVSIAVHETALSYMGEEIDKGSILYFDGMDRFLESGEL